MSKVAKSVLSLLLKSWSFQGNNALFASFVFIVQDVMAWT